MALTYFINKKSVTYVLSLTGTITAADTDILQKCIDEIDQSSPKYLILNMGAITSISKDAHSALTIFQRTIRQKSTLIICNVNDDILKILKTDGIIRESEVQSDLMSALKMILSMET